MLRLAFQNLFSRRARTVLATLGLTIALMGIVSLIAISKGVEAALSDTLDYLPGVTVIRRGVLNPALSRIPEWERRRAALEELPGVQHAIPQVFFPATLIDGVYPMLKDPMAVYLVVGIDVETVAELPGGGLFTRTLVEGRAHKAGAAEVLIPRSAARIFEKKIGDTISIQGEDLEVVGIFQVGSFFLDHGFIVPIEFSRAISQVSEGEVSAFYLELEEGADTTAVSDAVNASDPSLQGRTTADTENDFQALWGNVEAALAAIAMIALLVGAVGIVNTMLMSVIERTKELGVLRAVGWRKRDVVRLILIESAALGLLGGVFGCALGWLGVVVASQVIEFRLVATPGLLASSFVLAVLLGTFGGVYPAWRAAGLNPIEAIRS